MDAAFAGVSSVDLEFRDSPTVMDSRLRGNESIMQDTPSVIPAEAGIQKREQFFVILHNTSWIRDHRPVPEISSVRGDPCGGRQLRR